MRVPSSRPNHFPKAPLPNTQHWALAFNMHFGAIHSVYRKLSFTGKNIKFLLTWKAMSSQLSMVLLIFSFKVLINQSHHCSCYWFNQCRFKDELTLQCYRNVFWIQDNGLIYFIILLTLHQGFSAVVHVLCFCTWTLTCSWDWKTSKGLPPEHFGGRDLVEVTGHQPGPEGFTGTVMYAGYALQGYSPNRAIKRHCFYSPVQCLSRRLNKRDPKSPDFGFFSKATVLQPPWNQINLAPVISSGVQVPKRPPGDTSSFPKSSGARPGKTSASILWEGGGGKESSTPSEQNKSHAMGNHNSRSKTWLEARKVGFFLWTRNAKHSLN